MSVLDEATIRQNQAAEPNASTWLSANAGSGKTRVLTDRVARLLLDGVAPQNILCLTYTKAAASEMQNRLFKRLGEWSMKPDGALAEALSLLGVTALQSDHLARARRLFASAIETPGGLRIQTIHSFCASLLRRFPLEAGVSPRFTEMDDRAAVLLRDEIVEEMAEGDEQNLVDGIATYLTDTDLTSLTQGIVQRRESFAGDIAPDDILGWFGLAPGFELSGLMEIACDGSEPDLIAKLLPICQSLTKFYTEFGGELAGINLRNPGQDDFQGLCRLFLYASGDKKNRSKSSNFPQSNHKAACVAFAPILPELHAFMDRVAQAKDAEHGLSAARRSMALRVFAKAFLRHYSARKQARGWLDFDDLILKARALLSDETVAAWVLYRLDGGLDHILVDEAQDTSPAQWQVIERLAQEFTAGHGARDDVLRTIFVVGDKKQSIYSFQGADPREFDRMQAHFAERLAAIGIPLRPMNLEYSFRSSEAILRVVDQVIDPFLTSETKHRAFHSDLPGRVDIWAAVPKADKPEKPNWYDPVDIVGANHQDVILARKLAGRIKEMVGSETIPSENGGRRVVRAGDILILVRRRSRLFEEVIRACKVLELPVAGADRLKLGGELAVKDLSALLAFLATPEDDLSLAAALRSPLFGWSEAQLYDLAAGRAEPYLWTTLRHRAEEFSDTVKMLRDLLDQSDFLRPYDLIERILTRHDGRRRLLARLGPEAEDGIDALLNQSLAFERMEVPSLTGFLVWMETDDVQVKRQMDNAGDLIRVMTVHGAKGLESPIVILPDTAKRKASIPDEIVPLENGHPVWKPIAEFQPEVVKAALNRVKEAQEEEALRLLYVAMTRAETWLIVAAAGEIGEAGDSWYQMIAAGVADLGGVPFPSPTGPGLRYSHGAWDDGALTETAQPAARSSDLPPWAQVPLTSIQPDAKPAAPSGLGGAKVMIRDQGEAEQDQDAALREGRRVHRLLEHLPETPVGAWADLATALLATGEDSADAEEALRLLNLIEPVLNAPNLGHLFGPKALSEVEISAPLAELGGTRVNGAIDRLIVTPMHVLAVDFKTNAVVPTDPSGVPEGLLRQMGAYLAMLRQIYPERAVEVAILWTRTGALMTLPDNMVMDALGRTATS